MELGGVDGGRKEGEKCIRCCLYSTTMVSRCAIVARAIVLLQYYLLLTIIYYRTVLLYDTANLFLSLKRRVGQSFGYLIPATTVRG